MIDVIERKFLLVMQPINEHVTVFEQFKEMISFKLLAVLRELESFKNLFKEFAQEQAAKLGAFPPFKKGEQFYSELLDMNTALILEGLEEDLTRAKLESKRIQAQKETKIKALVDLFEQTLDEIKLDDKELNIEKSNLEEAIKTMRKLPVFGYTANGAHLDDYEWPKKEDMLAMPKN